MVSINYNSGYGIDIITTLQFIVLIRSTRTDLESEISNMCILDNNPKKPVVRMANLCVVSAHTVRSSFFGNLIYISHKLL